MRDTADDPVAIVVEVKPDNFSDNRFAEEFAVAESERLRPSELAQVISRRLRHGRKGRRE